MREQKKHWVGGKTVFGLPFSLCGRVLPAFANKQRAVTCKSCAKILRGYTCQKTTTG